MGNSVTRTVKLDTTVKRETIIPAVDLYEIKKSMLKNL